MKISNTTLNLCVVCDGVLLDSSYWICLNCLKPCKTFVENKIDETTFDIKSECCKSDVQNENKLTCSDGCHEKFVTEMIKEHGPFKKVTDAVSLKTYKVPLKVIIEKGLNFADLKSFPEWKDER